MRQMAQVYVLVPRGDPATRAQADTRVILCPDGRYLHSRPLGAGGAARAWDAATRPGAHGAWRVHGTAHEGTITLIAADGHPTSLRYRQCGRDCILFGDARWIIEGPANCSQ
jgi:hypothetical protein